MKNAKIVGTGRYLPPYRLTNDALSRMVDTSDEWIVSHTGIRERRIAQGETTAEMGYYAAQQALENAKIAPEEIDLIIGSTVTQDSTCPSMSCMIQGQLGAKNAFCFDQVAACSGFVFALETARQYIATGRVNTVLIVASEMLSKITDYTDRATCVLFGDGAGAAVLRAADCGGVLASYMMSDGARGDVLSYRAFENKSPFAVPREDTLSEHLFMNGHEVYKFAVRAMRQGMEAILNEAGISASDLAYMIPHQANIRIIASMVDKFGIPMEKVYINLEQYGNMSSACIPVALDELNRAGKLSRGDKLALVGFGGGLTCGAALLEW